MHYSIYLCSAAELDMCRDRPYSGCAKNTWWRNEGLTLVLGWGWGGVYSDSQGWLPCDRFLLRGKGQSKVLVMFLAVSNNGAVSDPAAPDWKADLRKKKDMISAKVDERGDGK